ncbi:MAG TPA: ATP-binding cassette domain-containing protein [Mycobacteriales bacterium]|nr:ATP-binding cassette domain-containing protein [Mycobacteriales bacterium]
MSELIEARGLVREFRTSGWLRRVAPVRAIDGVDLGIREGERFGIVGESGSGKSTLVRLLMGLDRPTSGTVHVDGIAVHSASEKELRPLRSVMQIVFQDPVSSLDPRMRVRDIIAEPLRGGEPGRVREVLEAVGLPGDAAGRYPHQFSGGQRQRIAIARALAPRPRIIVADEPVSALDVSIRAQILNLLLDLTEESGLTLVLVSHDLSVIRHMCHRTAVMHRGRIVESGPTAQVYGEPQEPYTAELLAAVPRLQYRPRRA